MLIFAANMSVFEPLDCVKLHKKTAKTDIKNKVY